MIQKFLNISKNTICENIKVFFKILNICNINYFLYLYIDHNI